MKRDGFARPLGLPVVSIALLTVALLGLAAWQMPGKALADGGTILAAGEPAVATQAVSPRVKLWVISKLGDSAFSDYRLMYNKKGQLTKMVSNDFKRTFKYKNNRLSSFKSQDVSGKNVPRNSSGKLSYDGKGRLKKVTSGGTFYSCSYTVQYTYDKKGRVVKARREEMPAPSTLQYAYDGKGRVSTSKSTIGAKYKYAYDKKSNLKSATYKSSGHAGAYRYDNSYSKGRISRQAASYGTMALTTHTFEYKRISVPKKYASQVKKQQWALVNPDVSFVFPTY